MNLPTRLHRHPLSKRLAEDIPYRLRVSAVLGLVFNLAYAFYHAILGFLSLSLLFTTSAVYYLLLGMMRVFAVLSAKKQTPQRDRQTARLVGGLFLMLSVVFSFTVLFGMRQHATVYGDITMITIATFTFTKITLASVTAAKRRRLTTRARIINRIRYAEVAVSLLTMQQSMLVSFGDIDPSSETVLNACTGAGVCVFIFLLGIVTMYHHTKKEN